MARVSQEHLDARRRQILDGAARCFARNGFHATSMQDVLKEVDLSAGAVYRYFSGKEELITAIAAEVLTEVRGAFAEVSRQTPPPPLDELVGLVLGRMMGVWASLIIDGEPGFPRLIMQVWAEAARDKELAAVTRQGYEGLRESWDEVFRTYQDSGAMRSDIPAEHVTRTVIAMVQGFIAQQCLFGPAPVSVLQDGLRALTSMSGTRTTA
ncbi:TetR/AcrR family transcriptional regulator [Streptomyces sp. NPDC092369]|uniref:TetR/AcrR family transcriptional regulator n=1 Tax=Streptomyces sp. NPDC092369 TaxID=3366015 RepID=UPI003817162E